MLHGFLQLVLSANCALYVSALKAKYNHNAMHVIKILLAKVGMVAISNERCRKCLLKETKVMIY